MEKELLKKILEKLEWLQKEGQFFHSAIELSSFNEYGGEDFKKDLDELIIEIKNTE